VLEIIIKGEGEVTIALFDRNGRLLLGKRLRISGQPRIEARSRLPLVLQTARGDAPVVPVLLRRSRLEQEVTFNGVEPSSFMKDRYRALKVQRAAAEKISQTVKLFEGEVGPDFPMILRGATGKR
jgi:hypothetical protein